MQHFLSSDDAENIGKNHRGFTGCLYAHVPLTRLRSHFVRFGRAPKTRFLNSTFSKSRHFEKMPCSVRIEAVKQRKCCKVCGKPAGHRPLHHLPQEFLLDGTYPSGWICEFHYYQILDKIYVRGCHRMSNQNQLD